MARLMLIWQNLASKLSTPSPLSNMDPNPPPKETKPNPQKGRGVLWARSERRLCAVYQAVEGPILQQGALRPWRPTYGCDPGSCDVHFGPFGLPAKLKTGSLTETRDEMRLPKVWQCVPGGAFRCSSSSTKHSPSLSSRESRNEPGSCFGSGGELKKKRRKKTPGGLQ